VGEGRGRRQHTTPRLREHLRPGHVELVQDDLPLLERVCHAELAKEQTGEP
jgi:hypothetical protein